MDHVDDPERMSPEERATEVAAILAARRSPPCFFSSCLSRSSRSSQFVRAISE